ncbi:MAG: Eco57I restriction-modification methylase domain-containing protein [Planctomycetales bacterium]|nr:Eco57I restriction-modification methylase domain-containing protein [Planctomycetales bacterium]
MGQFATPTKLATEIVGYGQSLLGSHAKLQFFDPAIGTGSFYSALLSCVPTSRIKSAFGIEVDPHYGLPALDLWRKTNLRLQFGDFTKAIPAKNELANFVVCNPPYVRHHHLHGEDKLRLRALIEQQTGIRLSGLAGLYCYFLLLSQRWMLPSGIAGWLIPSEFMDVNYGDEVKAFLLNRVTLLHIHRFDPAEVQFDDALVSSAVVWFRNEPPPPNHVVRFSFGGTLATPRQDRFFSLNDLRAAPKWSRLLTNDLSPPLNDRPVLGDFFRIQRGLATGSNEFFVLSEEQIKDRQLPQKFFSPILPSPRYLPVDEVKSNPSGIPVLKQSLFLLDCDLPEETVQDRYPNLWKYLERGVDAGVSQRYLCQHRSPWYSQERRSPPQLLCTYMGRTTTSKGRPFRFILNHSKAVAANVYLLLYPRPKMERMIRDRPSLLRELWRYLNNLPIDSLTSEGRVYGGGLYKLEPRELANLPIEIQHMVDCKAKRRRQHALFE